MPPRLNIPPITRGLLLALGIQSCLSFFIRYRQWTADSDIVVPYLTLVPQLSFIYPWTFLTTTLVENNVFTLAISGATIFYGGRYLERAWTSTEFMKFLVVVALLPNLGAFAVLVMMFAATGDMRWSLTSINGTIALQSAFLIAFSQLVPTHTVTLFRGILSLRVPRFPLLHLLLITLLSLTPLLSIASFLLATLGFSISWTYLRFYKPALPDLDTSQPSSLRGDASDSFAFAEFFPDPTRPAVSTFSDGVYNILVALHICTPFSSADIAASQSREGSSYAGSSRPNQQQSSTRAETERRRALALKALDQRLQNATGAGQAPKVNQPSGSVGGDVVSQPKVNAQTAMTSQPGSMLGETSYVPDGEEMGKGAS